MNSHDMSALAPETPNLQGFLQQHLQTFVQQQLRQAGQKSRRGIQIHCTVNWARSLISVDLCSPIELDPQNIFAVLEKLVKKAVSERPDSKAIPCLSITLSLWEPGNKHTYECHSFTLDVAEHEDSADILEYKTDPLVLKAPKTSRKAFNPIVALAVVAAALSGGLSYYAFAQEKTGQFPASAIVSLSAPSPAVVALGRIEPQGGIINVSVANAQESRVNRLLVKEGDRVQAGQAIAILQGIDNKEAELMEAQQRVEIARAKLEQSRSGSAKHGEISAQMSNIARLEAQLRTATLEKQAEITQVKAELRSAQTDYQRHQQLQRVGAMSRSILDNKQEAVEIKKAELDQVYAQLENLTATLQKQIQQERSLLFNLSDVRPVDVKVFQTELDYALTQVNQAKTELDDLYVRAPVGGQILRINTRVGEQVKTGEGIVELGQTEQMYAIAEVYETDVRKIKRGQRATIVSENGSFAGELRGTVEQVGLQIKKKDVLDTDPTAEKDARVVEVKIRLEPRDTAKVAKFSNLQVRIRIH